MFLRKKFRDADKQITQGKDFVVDSDGDALINVKITDESQIFSSYNYDSNEKLKSDLSDFIYDKARFVPANKDIRIKVFSMDEVDETDVGPAIKNNYKKDYIEIRNDIRHNTVFSIIMLGVGLLFFALLLFMHNYFYNIYLEIIMEIATWVFIWEAVDAFFLRRLQLKRKRNILLKLYMAKIDVVNLKPKVETDETKNKEEK